MKDFLLDRQRRYDEIKKKVDSIADTRRAVSFTRSSRSGISSQVEVAAEQREKLLKELDLLKDEIDREKRRRLEIIFNIDCSYDRMMLYWKYIELLGVQEIAFKARKTTGAVYKYYLKQKYI
ncbi:MAG: hypothetical protein K6G45_13040 [Lachnospiraceae bacterium]|nr:hypothetical protein [Lachnospiraceae bacterium]